MNAPHSNGSIRKILVADDEHLIADTLKLILSAQGFEVLTAYDGDQAIDAARSWQPDVFLTDVVMPHRSGIDAAMAICAMIPACRVLLLSGQAGVIDLVREARDQGFRFDLLDKPIHPTRLLAHLRTL